MISEAHRLSQSAVVDPAYSAEELVPPSPAANDQPFWHYAPDDLELYLLEEMRLSFIREKRNVGWLGKFRPIAWSVVFFREFESSASLEFRSTGTCSAELDGEVLALSEREKGSFHCEVPRAGVVKLTVASDTLPSLGSSLEWRILREDGTHVQAERLPQMKSGLPPHLEAIPELPLKPEKQPDGSYDAGREVFGWIEADSNTLPLLCAGESRYEMANENPALSEQDLGVIAAGNGKIRSRSPIAFRYFRFSGTEPENVRCRLLIPSEQYRGAFAGPGRLNDLWMRSAYTLRLCMYHFLLDGIKRDRMPWAGDLSLSLLSNAYSFGNGAIVKRTLTVLGCSGPEFGDVNGCTDFSCWLTICHDLYQQYFHDPEYLSRSWQSIRARTDALISRCDSNGFLSRNLQWVFIDWSPGCKQSALQVLFYHSLRSAARLAERLEKNDDAGRWNAFAFRLKQAIYQNCFSEKKGLFRARLDSTEEYTRHANLFALLSGMAEEKDRPGLLNAICNDELPPFGTPFLQAWELLVAAEAGKLEFFRKKLDDVWGYMLDQGATTFWEGCGNYASEKDYCAFYGRPYGASLCHAWASGPAFLLPRILMGLAPVEDGWKTFRCRPVRNFGNFCCTVPTPDGPIEASWKDGILTLNHPDSLTCLRD